MSTHLLVKMQTAEKTIQIKQQNQNVTTQQKISKHTHLKAQFVFNFSVKVPVLVLFYISL